MPTASRRSRSHMLRHWSVVVALTLLGLLAAEWPIFSRLRDQTYLLVQEHLIRSQKSVIIVAIDDKEFWHGEPNGKSPLDRSYLAKVLEMVSDANPSVIGIDVGLEVPGGRLLAEDETRFLKAVNAAAKRSFVVLPQTIRDCGGALCVAHDMFDEFTLDERVTLGYTSSAIDTKQIPMRSLLHDGTSVDSFALAIFRHAARDVPPEFDDPSQPWPLSLFLPETSFTPRDMRVNGLLTVRDLRQASPEQREKWLGHQIVLIGGVWHATPHGGALVDEHEAPTENLSGVIMQANYVQSLLWDAMRPMPHLVKLPIEIILSLTISVVFAVVQGWRRLLLVIVLMLLALVSAWIVSAFGLFFDMAVPVVFLGLHACWEKAAEVFHFGFRSELAYEDEIFAVASVLLVIGVAWLFVKFEMLQHVERLATEDRLQVVEVDSPPAAPTSFPTIPTTTTGQQPNHAQESKRRSQPSDEMEIEHSPERSQVALVDVPRQCLENGFAEKNGFRYTCTKVDTADVWNEIVLRMFEKEIFEASKAPASSSESTRIGLVVRQDSVYTAMQVKEGKVVPNRRVENQVALVERRDGSKYRYKRR